MISILMHLSFWLDLSWTDITVDSGRNVTPGVGYRVEKFTSVDRGAI